MLSKYDMDTDNIETDRIQILNNNDSFLDSQKNEYKIKKTSFSGNKIDQYL